MSWTNTRAGEAGRSSELYQLRSELTAATGKNVFLSLIPLSLYFCTSQKTLNSGFLFFFFVNYAPSFKFWHFH